MRIVYIGFAFPHHKNTHAGYHQIKDELKYDYIVDCQSYYDKVLKKKSFIERFLRRILLFFFGFRVTPWFLIKLIYLGLRYNDCVFHFIYGENLFLPFKKLIRKGNKIVCTFHQPLKWFEENYYNQKKIEEIDCLILMSNIEIDAFKRYFHNENVYFIPHGIHSDFYHKNARIKKEKLILTVGNWLRDYTIANRVYEKLVELDPDIRIVVVANVNNLSLISLREQIELCHGISDEELLDYYCKSSVLFLPLTRYTANNSLLEASATGCNIIIATNSRDNSYIPDDYLTIVPLEEDIITQTILTNINYSYNDKLSEFIAENYSWDTIARRTYKCMIELFK